MNPVKRFACLAFCLMCLSACGPSEQRQAEIAEKHRIACLDTLCPGDVEPEHDRRKEVALKLNGQWYVGPREYFGGRKGAVFYWPSKTPKIGLPDGKSYPERGKPFYDVAIEIFLTSRHRWHKPHVAKPWDTNSWERRWAERQASGLRMERTEARLGLDVIRFEHADGTPYRFNYYVATGQRRIRGPGPPVASCDAGTHRMDRCTSGEFVFDDVFADFRFNVKHAQDWPQIHEELVRVLRLLRRIEK